MAPRYASRVQRLAEVLEQVLENGEDAVHPDDGGRPGMRSGERGWRRERSNRTRDRARMGVCAPSRPARDTVDRL